MGIQSSVNFNQGFGVPGELYTNSPVRGQSFELRSADPANNVFGRAFSIFQPVPGTLVAAAGNSTGLQPFAGIMVNPKGAKSNGIIGNPLAPTITLPNGTTSEFVNFGELVVLIYLPFTDNNVSVGDVIIYQITTGILGAVKPTGVLPPGFQIAPAAVTRFKNTAPIVSPSEFRYAVIRVTTTSLDN
jgi:hypothetical protein